MCPTAASTPGVPRRRRASSSAKNTAAVCRTGAPSAALPRQASHEDFCMYLQKSSTSADLPHFHSPLTRPCPSSLTVPAVAPATANEWKRHDGPSIHGGRAKVRQAGLSRLRPGATSVLRPLPPLRTCLFPSETKPPVGGLGAAWGHLVGADSVVSVLERIKEDRSHNGGPGFVRASKGKRTKSPPNAFVLRPRRSAALPKRPHNFLRLP